MKKGSLFDVFVVHCCHSLHFCPLDCEVGGLRHVTPKPAPTHNDATIAHLLWWCTSTPISIFLTSRKWWIDNNIVIVIRLYRLGFTKMLAQMLFSNLISSFPLISILMFSNLYFMIASDCTQYAFRLHWGTSELSSLMFFYKNDVEGLSRLITRFYWQIKTIWAFIRFSKDLNLSVSQMNYFGLMEPSERISCAP